MKVSYLILAGMYTVIHALAVQRGYHIQFITMSVYMLLFNYLMDKARGRGEK